MSKHAGRPQGSPLLMAGIGLALALALSCTSDIETAEDVLAQLGKSSSSAEPSGTVFCMFPNGVCSGPIALDACNFLDGTLVQSCGTASSSPSSAAVPLSSSVVPPPGSSSAVLSSSSVLVASNCDGMAGAAVIIGSQTWMKSNLNCDVSGSKCYGNDDGNCATYGRLYDWATAMGLSSSCNSSTCSGQISNPHRGICPSGWHIPSNADWDKLYRYVDENNGNGGYVDYGNWGYYYTVGKHLKSSTGWNSYSGIEIENLDTYGFSALPGGHGRSGGGFDSVGLHGSWWSSSEYAATYAYARYMDCFGEIASWNWGNGYKSYLFSVRCVKD